VIVTYGRIVSEAIEAARLIHEKTKDTCGILLLEALKPYDRTAEAITALLPKGVKKVLFLEEGIKNGGAGMLLSDKLSLPDGCRYTVLAIDDVFDTDRSTGNLYADFGLGREDILAAFDN
jgi:transketolase C-terminal domain/subunit